MEISCTMRAYQNAVTLRVALEMDHTIIETITPNILCVFKSQDRVERWLKKMCHGNYVWRSSRKTLWKDGVNYVIFGQGTPTNRLWGFNFIQAWGDAGVDINDYAHIVHT